MTDILVGAKVTTTDFTVAQSNFSSATLNPVTSTTYSAGSTEVGTSFTAPTSGRVLITVGLGARATDGANRVHLAPEVYTGSNASGSLVLAADVASRGVGTPAEATGYMYMARTSLLSGLTPGSTYYARVMHKVSGGGANNYIVARSIVVEPTT